jgi:NADPH:quinone reductase-like Zn-dependent oxidoreductase
MSQPIPPTVQAIFQPDVNSTDLILKDLPSPVPDEGSDQHLIRVHATAPCTGELTWAKYFPAVLFADEPPEKRPLIPCYDLAGVVVTSPANSPFQPGTEVYTRTPATRSGNARLYTIACTSELALKPKNLSWEEAASVPLSVFTALQGLFTHGGLADLTDPERKQKNADKSVLITAASGSVGSWMLQLARSAGVGHVVGVCGTSNVEYVKSLGATDVIDYRQSSVKEWAAAHPDFKFDLVIDSVGGQMLAQTWYAVRNGGTLLSISGQPDSVRPEDATATDVKNSFYIMETNGEELVPVTKLLEAKEVRPFVDSVWTMKQYREAFQKLETGHPRGKIIIKVSD